MLACPVRDCHLILAHENRRVFCPRGHSFDIARSGYINLLQPQDRRSRHPGDTPAAVAARRRLHDLGVTKPLLDAVARIIEPSPADTVLDAGCANGDLLGALAAQTGFRAHGVDISVAAVDAAARRYPGCEWIVANVDRFVPYATGSFTVVLSITARTNAAEFRRVLHGEGRLLMAIPSPEDLVELRGRGPDRVPQTLEALAPHFRPETQHRVTAAADLDAAAVEDVLHSIYRPLQRQPAKAARLTFSLDLLLFRMNP